MNIFIYELKTYRMSLLYWCAGITALIAMFMAIYPSFAVDTELMDKMLANYPEAMLKAFGMDSGLPLSSVPGYFTFSFAFVQLLLAIQSSNYGFRFLSVEETELTADFLLSKPVSRSRIITAKLSAVLIILIITNAVVWAGSFGFIELFRDGHDYNSADIALLLASVPVFQIFFIGVGAFISVIVKKVRSVLAFSVALAFGMYIMNALRNIAGGKALGLITPFHHFDPVYILKDGIWEMQGTITSIAVIVLSVTGAWILYLRRDIHSL